MSVISINFSLCTVLILTRSVFVVMGNVWIVILKC